MKKRVKRKFNFGKFIIFVILIVILYFLINYLLNVKTKNIVILNSNYYTDEKIIETANIQDYPKFVLLNKKKIKKKLESLDLIEEENEKKKYGY